MISVQSSQIPVHGHKQKSDHLMPTGRNKGTDNKFFIKHPNRLELPKARIRSGVFYPLGGITGGIFHTPYEEHLSGGLGDRQRRLVWELGQTCESGREWYQHRDFITKKFPIYHNVCARDYLYLQIRHIRNIPIWRKLAKFVHLPLKNTNTAKCSTIIH